MENIIGFIYTLAMMTALIGCANQEKSNYDEEDNVISGDKKTKTMQ